MSMRADHLFHSSSLCNSETYFGWPRHSPGAGTLFPTNSLRPSMAFSIVTSSAYFQVRAHGNTDSNSRHTHSSGFSNLERYTAVAFAFRGGFVAMIISSTVPPLIARLRDLM